MYVISPLLKKAFECFPKTLYLPILFGKMRGNYWIPKSANPAQVIGRYELEHEAMLVELLNSSSVFWDVGSHVGWYSLMASKEISGKIYSFEPNPENFDYLQEHIKINNSSNVKLVNKALSDSNGESYFSGENQQGSLSAIGTYKVQTITADEFIKQEGIIPDLIKVDIEGAETKFLNGAKKLLTDHSPKLLLSAHGYKKRDECVAILTELGFKINHLVSNTQDGDYVFSAIKN